MDPLLYQLPAAILCLVGLIFLSVGIGMLVSARRRSVECTARTTGIVADVLEKFDPEHGTTYTPVFEYHVGGIEPIQRKHPISSSKPRYQIGDSVVLYFDPDKPKRFYIEGDRRHTRMYRFAIAMGALCLVLAAVLVILFAL